MFRSLHMKLVLIMLLLITSLMAVVGAFLMTSVTGFYIDAFYQQVESVFGSDQPGAEDFYRGLTSKAAQSDLDQAETAIALVDMVEAKAGDLGLNASTRTYYILDGRTGEYLAGSRDADSFYALPASTNLLAARTAVALLRALKHSL